MRRWPQFRQWLPVLGQTKAVSLLVFVRIGSTASSFLLIASFARVLPVSEFGASQLALVLVGLVGVIADPGLGLATTRAVAIGDYLQVPQLLYLRCVLTALSLLIIGAGAAVLYQQQAELLATLVPAGLFVWVLLLRNHIFVQARVLVGVRYEVAAGCAANIVESLSAALAIMVTGNVSTALWLYLIAGTMGTGALWYDVNRRAGHRRLSLGLKAPLNRHIVSTFIVGGLAPSIVGVAGKLFAAVLVHVASEGPPGDARWNIVAARTVDSLFPLLVALLVYPRYVFRAQGAAPSGSTEQSVLFPGGVVLVVAACIGPAVLSGHIPTLTQVGTSISLAIVFALITGICDMAYEVHALEGNVQWRSVLLMGVAVAVVPAVATSASLAVALVAAAVVTAGAYSSYAFNKRYTDAPA
jgi:hypothetical protein